MEYGFSILMAAFSVALLIYAGLMALFKNYRMIPLRARVSFKPKNEKKYMIQLAKVIALTTISPALSALLGLWNPFVGLIVLILAAIFFISLGTKVMKNVK